MTTADPRALADRWINAQEAAKSAMCDFEDLLIGDDEDTPTPILPRRDFDRITYDFVDWEGFSLEFKGYVGAPPTPEERERIWALGFTVIRLDYADPALRTTQHKFHGDWSCVKGQEPHEGRPIRVGVDRCPVHFMDAKGSGQCALLAGHVGRCEREPSTA